MHKRVIQYMPLGRFQCWIKEEGFAWLLFLSAASAVAHEIMFNMIAETTGSLPCEAAASHVP